MFSELQINQLCNVSAFVRHVGEIKTFTNSRGEGALFNIDLEDANGDRVRATMFSTPSDVQASWETLSGSTNQSIHLTNCRVKQPNAKFSSDRIELQLSKNTAISEGKKFVRKPPSFTQISELQTNDTKNIQAVVTETYERKEITTKKMDTLVMQKVRLSDSSGSILLTIWSPVLNLKKGDVVECLEVRCNLFRDVHSLQTTEKSSIAVVQCERLRRWWQSTPIICPRLPVIQKKYSTLSAIKARTRPGVSYGIFTLGSVNHEYFSYVADPITKQKVVKRGDNWFNEKTQKYVTAAQSRYLMTVKLMDPTGALKVTLFNDVMESLLHLSCNDLVRKNKTEQYAILQQLEFKEFACNIQTRQDGDEIRHSVANAISIHDEKACIKYT